MNNATENLKLAEEFTTSGLEHICALSELNLRTWEKMAEQQMNTFDLIVDNGVKQLQLATQTKEVAELIKGQAELTRELRNNLMVKNQESVDLSAKTGKEYRSWMEQGTSAFARNINKATVKSA